MKKLIILFTALLLNEVLHAQQFISQQIYTEPKRERYFNETILYNNSLPNKTTQCEFTETPSYKETIIYKKRNGDDSAKIINYHHVDKITRNTDGHFIVSQNRSETPLPQRRSLQYLSGADSVAVMIEIIEKKNAINRFGIFGYGNLNAENEQKINGSSKFSCYFVPVVSSNQRFQSIVNLSFNKNATNSDTLVGSTLLFPELGNAAFIGTLEAQWRLGDLNKKPNFFLSAFGEFGLKNVKAKINDTAFTFDILNYTLGGRFSYNYSFEVKQGDEMVQRNATFSIIPYIHFSNIPNEDNEDYRTIFKEDKLPSVLFSLGVKVLAQYHHFGIFADLKSMTKNAEINNRDIKGFNSNIGVVVSGELLQF